MGLTRFAHAPPKMRKNPKGAIKLYDGFSSAENEMKGYDINTKSGTFNILISL